MNRINNFLNELDGKGKVFSALFGALTLFAVLGVVAPGLYEQMPEYTEWICGVTTWSAYNKQADMNLVQTAMIGLPVLFVLFAVIYVRWQKTMAAQSQVAGTAFATAYIVILCMVYRGNSAAIGWFLLWLCLWIGYCVLGKSGRTAQFEKAVTGAAVWMLAMTAGVLFLNGFFAAVGSLWNRVFPIVTVSGAVVFFLLVFVKKCGDKADLLLELQLLLPLAWLGFIHFRYRYEKDGSLLELFGSGRWKWTCVLFCVFFLGISILERVKRGRRLFFTTFVMTAVVRVFSQPEGLLNIDYFHNGEITMPMQQLVSYGKLPYRDIIPIHGMCDYYYGLINYLFFDGTYLSLNAAKVAGDLLMAVLLAIVLYFFAAHKLQSLAIVYFFVPFMILSAGMRYWLLFVMFFTLFSPRIQKGMQSLYVWIWLSILAITWNASIGGAAALAFLPMILYRLRRDFLSQWRGMRNCPDKMRRNLTWIAWGVLVAAGIAFIPLFLQIVGYLRENTGTTLYVNGMEMLSEVSQAAEYFVPGLVTGQGNFFIDTFAFLISLLVAFVLIFRKEKTGAGEVFVTYLLAFWVLTNYAFVRYDEGLRAKVLGIFFLMLTAVVLLYRMCFSAQQGERRNGVILYVAALGIAVMLAGTGPFVTADSLVLEKDVPEYIQTEIMGQEIDDPVVHVSGDLVGIPGIGTGFVQGNTLASLQNVNALVQAAKQNEQSVFDITNAVANAVTLDMPLYLPYSSAYNISNAVMQENAIGLLADNLPDIILAAPEIRFDDAPFSFRSIQLYRYLMEQDYVPYKYENVIYLVRGENPLPQAQQNTEAFAQLMHKKDLAYLPAVWGSNAGNMSQTLSEVAVDYRIEPLESGFRVVFDAPVSGDAIAMIGIACPDGSAAVTDEARESEKRVSMTIPSSIAASGEAVFEFVYAGKQMLLPVCSSPYFTLEEQIEYLEFETDALEDVKMMQGAVKFYEW